MSGPARLPDGQLTSQQFEALQLELEAIGFFDWLAAGRLAMNTPQLDTLCAAYRDGLLHDTMPFWFPRSLDLEHGGFLHCLDRDGTVLDTDKSVWAQGRMSWMLLAAL